MVAEELEAALRDLEDAADALRLARGRRDEAAAQALDTAAARLLSARRRVDAALRSVG